MTKLRIAADPNGPFTAEEDALVDRALGLDDAEPFIPAWRRRALAGEGFGKDMTGTVAA